MTELGRDARALVTRVKRQDGPSAADRERLRHKLERAWAAQPAELAPTAELTAAPRFAQSWTSWTSGLLLLSLGFITPETPRTFAPQPTAEPAPLAAAEATRAVAPPSAAEPARQPSAPPSAAAPADGPAAHHEPASRVNRAALRRSQRPAEALAARARGMEPKPAARTVEPAPAAGTEPAPAAVRDTAPQTVAVRDGEAEPRPTARYGSQSHDAATSGGDLALNLRNDGFSPQPIDDELTWLSAAQEALTKHQPSAALRLVQEHAFRFPQGALAVERTAVHALALCALGRKAAARDVIADLAHRAPQSPLLARVQRNCGM